MLNAVNTAEKRPAYKAYYVNIHVKLVKVFDPYEDEKSIHVLLTIFDFCFIMFCHDFG